MKNLNALKKDCKLLKKEENLLKIIFSLLTHSQIRIHNVEYDRLMEEHSDLIKEDF